MGDQFDKIRDAFITLITAIGLAIILVFIVMVAQFESFFLPFVIMFSMPFGVIGVYWGLYLTGNTINIISGAGILLLAGIVVKNAIVLVDHVNILRLRGETRWQSLMDGSRDRLRPILMTTLTTIVGLSPMAMGANDQGRMIYSPLAIAVFGGMLTSTVLIPIITPTIYSISDDVVIRLRNWYKALKSAARG
jgi:HAE1 family hydrophobic/amphiphilic exporter-1